MSKTKTSEKGAVVQAEVVTPQVMPDDKRLAAQIAEGKRLLGTDLNAREQSRRLLYEEFSATVELGSEADLFALLRGEEPVKEK